MPIYEDMLSDEKVLDETLEGDTLPLLRLRNQIIRPVQAHLLLTFNDSQLLGGELKLFINQESELKKLERLFLICGFKNIRYLELQLKKPKTLISVTFAVKEALIKQYGAECLPLKTAEAFFAFETPFGQEPFMNLDLAYTFLQAQVQYEGK